VLWN
jgi:hypothetical protein